MEGFRRKAFKEEEISDSNYPVCSDFIERVSPYLVMMNMVDSGSTGGKIRQLLADKNEGIV